MLKQECLIIGECLEYTQSKVFEYSPNLIKSATTGHGHASKESIQKYIKMTLGIDSFKSHDESDAIAIALCHILSNGTKQVLRKAVRKIFKVILTYKVSGL